MLLPSFNPRRPLGVAPGQASEEELTVAQLLRILVRRWAVAVPVFAAVVALTWWMYARQTPVYEAATSIRIDKSKEAIPGLSPNAMVGYESPYELSTEMQIIQSRSVSREVAQRTDYALRVIKPGIARSALIDSIGPLAGARVGRYLLIPHEDGRVEAIGPSGSKTRAKPGTWLAVDGLLLRLTGKVLAYESVIISVLSEEAATDAVRSALKVTQPVRDAEVLRISVRDSDPRLAAATSDAVAEVFTASQTRRRQSGGRSTVAFIRWQLDTLDTQLADAEVKLRDWRAAQKLVVPAAEAGNAVARRATLDERLAERRLELDNIEQLLAASGGADTATRLKKGFRAVLSSPTMKANMAGNAILSTLLELESKRAELKLRRTDEDPEVKVIDRTIADYEGQGQLFVRSYMNALRSEIGGLDRVLVGVGTRLESLPGQELELTKLQRNAEVLATLQGTLRTRLKEAEITNASNEPTSELLDRATAPNAPIAPVRSRYAAVGIVSGFLLALVLAVLRDRMDRTIHSREDIERAAGVPLMGLIPSFDTGEGTFRRLRRRRKLARGRPNREHAVMSRRGTVASSAVVEHVMALRNPRHVSSEAYRVLRTNLRFAPAEQARQVLTITSPSPGDGKSTTALNYAATVALQGKKVLLIDGDMRRGRQHAQLGITRVPGLSGVLTGEVAAEEAVHTVEMADGVTMDVLAAGDVPPNPAELLGDPIMASLIAWARGRYETVIVDTPPVNMFADGLLLAAAGDAVLLVGRAGKSFRDELAIAAEQVRNLSLPIAGVVLNDYDVRRDSRFGSAYYYYDRYYHRYYAAYTATDERGSAA